MPRLIDDELEGLAHRNFDVQLDGLEDRIWTRVQTKNDAARTSSIGVRATLTLAALAIGLLFGVLHPRSTQLAEMGIVSEDGAFAPSVRLGG